MPPYYRPHQEQGCPENEPAAGGSDFYRERPGTVGYLHAPYVLQVSTRPRLLGGFVFVVLALAAVFFVHGVRLASVEHVVKPGDTLFRVAHQYYGDGHLYACIADANGLRVPYVIKPGTRLVIPSAASPSDFIIFMAGVILFVFIGFIADVPAFSAARRLVGASLPSSAAASAFVTALFTCGSLLGCIALWGAVGAAGTAAAAPVVFAVTAVLRARALAPAYDGSSIKAAAAWVMASLMSGSVLLLILLAGAAMAGERASAVLKSLVFLAPR